MKNKIIFTFCAIITLNFLPLIGNPILMLHYKTLIISTAACILWLTQPGFSASEMNINKKNDRLSVLIILFCSSLSVFSSVFEWGYVVEKKSEINFLTVIGFIFLLTGIIIRVVSINILGKHFTATVNIVETHELDRKSTRLNSSHGGISRMPSSA